MVVRQSQNGYPSSQSFQQANLAVGKRIFAATKDRREECSCLSHLEIARAWSSYEDSGRFNHLEFRKPILWYHPSPWSPPLSMIEPRSQLSGCWHSRWPM